LQVYVREMDFHTIRFDFGVGQNQSPVSSEPYTLLEVSTEWIHRNLMASGRRLSLLGALQFNINDFSMQPKTEISYTEPWLWKYRVPTTFRLFNDYFNIEGYDQPIRRYGADLTFLHTQRRLLTLKSTLTFQQTVVPDTAPASQEIERGRERSLGFLYRKDTRENFLYPTQGSVIEASPEFFVNVLGGNADFYKIEISLSKYWSMPLNSTLAGRIKLGSLHYYDGVHGYIPDYEKFRLGGATSVRGFRPDGLKTVRTSDGKILPVGDNVKLLMNLEWRFPIYWKFGGEAFFDAGQLWPDYSALDILKLRPTAGIGITFATPLGPARVDFGRKLGVRKKYEKPWVSNLALQYAF